MAAIPAAPASLLVLLLATMTSTLLLLPVPSFAASSQNPADFIRRSCNSTLYPSLCYSSLAHYAGAVAGHDPTHLALAAANVTLAAVQAVHSYLTALRRTLVINRRVDARTAAALGDCVESLDDAVDLTQQAAAELWMLPTAEGNEVGWRVSNAQTWMSAAMTCEVTCTDGFEESAAPAGREGSRAAAAAAAGGAGRWSVKEDVRRRVELAERYTSNALALVNGLVG